jgi:hypothetical protein
VSKCWPPPCVIYGAIPARSFLIPNELTACFSPRISHGADFAAGVRCPNSDGAASVAPFLAAVLTEIYPRTVCPCQEINVETQRPRPGSNGPLINACYVWLPIRIHQQGGGLSGLPLQISDRRRWDLEHPFDPSGVRPSPAPPPPPPPSPPAPATPLGPTPAGYTAHTQE